MTRAMIVVALVGLAFSPVTAGGRNSVSGQYVEARTAEVFTGGCIMGSEAETVGKQAVLAWKVDRGSFDGVNYTRIASNAVPPFTARNEIQSIPILNNTNAFQYYRVTFPTIANAATANSIQLAELELLPYAEFTSTNDLVTATATGSLWSAPERLTDRHLVANEDKFAVQDNTGNVVVDITPAAGATVLKGFEIIGANDSGVYAERHPMTLAISASQDGTNFVQLGAFTPSRPTADRQIEEFALPTNTVAYVKYRFNFGPQQSGVWWQLGEVRLFGEIIPTPAVLNVRASGTNVLVSWPTSPGFALERKTTLSDANWVAVTNAFGSIASRRKKGSSSL